jgi:signal transduction histidine kinase
MSYNVPHAVVGVGPEVGMGLAIAKGIIEAHDRKIWIESGARGKGTRVLFTLPIGDEEIVEGVRYSAATVEKQ